MAELAFDERQVIALLGGTAVVGKTVRRRQDWVPLVRRGLPERALASLIRAIDLDRPTVDRLVGPNRTLARRKGKLLRQDESDRLLRLARVAAAAVHTLGSVEKARGWLGAPNRALGGETPLALLDTDVGARDVENLLGRIAYGVFS